MSVLERILDDDWIGLRRNFEKLERFVIDTGGRLIGLRFGTATVTYPGAAISSSFLTVTHGLGKTPIAVFLTGAASSANNAWEASSLTDTTFKVRATTLDGSSPAASTTRDFYWLALG